MRPAKHRRPGLARRALLTTYGSVAVAGLLFSGCFGQERAAAVDPGRARRALQTALESWKKGDTIEQLRSNSPSIVAQDFDWMAGARLVDYEVTGDGKDDDANLRIPVKLSLRTAQGKDLSKSVSYVVGTSPVLTVFREMN